MLCKKCFTNSITAWGVFRHRLFDMVPTARDAVIEGMGDAVIVLDTRNRVVDLNPAAQEIIGHTASGVIGQPAAWVFSRWPDLVEQYEGAIEAHAEIVVGENEGQCHFDLRLSPLRDRHGRLTGRLIVLHDITERVENNAQLLREIAKRVQAEEALRISHRFLEVANRYTGMPAMLGECVAQVRAFTGCAAVGIRLLDYQGNIPYHAYEGFSRRCVVRFCRP
jgi:PAS domain S-box-containing protein